MLGQSDYVFGTAPGRVSGTMVSGVGNNLLKWETVEDWNVGVDTVSYTHLIGELKETPDGNQAATPCPKKL